jgi:hypothetical protein
VRTLIKPLLTTLSALGLLAVALSLHGEPPQAGQPDEPARYWKGNLHTHSFWSDGDDFPEMIGDWYKKNGYDFLALSDHNVLATGERWIDLVGPKFNREEALRKCVTRFGDNWLERRRVLDKMGQEKDQVRLKTLREFRQALEVPGKFLVIPAEEITHSYAKAPVHLNAVNLRDVIKPIDGPSVAETIDVNLRVVADQEKRAGWRILAFVNHPNFKWGLRAEDMVHTPALRFFEVFNGHSSVNNYGDELHASCERMWDIILALRLGKHSWPVLYGLATDDAHRYHKWGVGFENPGRGWIMVRAKHLNPDALLRAMDAGDFYASSGVVLSDVRREGNTLKLAIKPEEGVRYKTQFIATLRGTSFDSAPVIDKDGKQLDVTRVYSADIGKVVAESDSLTPEYRLTGQEFYVRAKVISSKLHPNPFKRGDHEVAWTQPLVP